MNRQSDCVNPNFIIFKWVFIGMKIKNCLTTDIQFVAVLFIFSCSVQEEFVDRLVSEGNINLDDLAPGQKSVYIRYASTCGLPGINFTGDTLILETIIFNNQIHLKESNTARSPSFTGGYRLFEVSKITGDVIIPDREGSALFFFYGNDTIHLKPSTRVDLVQNGCRLSLAGNNFTGDEIGYVRNFRVGSIMQANKTVVSCVPAIYQMDAYLIYDENYLYMSHTVLTNGDQTGVSGWKLVY